MAISHNYKNDAAISTVKPNVQAINELKRVSRKKWRSFAEKAILAACVTLPATVVLYAAVRSNSSRMVGNVIPIGARLDQAMSSLPVVTANPIENKELLLIDKNIHEELNSISPYGKYYKSLINAPDDAITAILSDGSARVNTISPSSLAVVKRAVNYIQKEEKYRGGPPKLRVIATVYGKQLQLIFNKNQITAINLLTKTEDACNVELKHITQKEGFFLEMLREAATSGVYASPKNGIAKMEKSLDDITGQADALKSQAISAQRKEVNKILTDYERAKGILPKNLRS